MWCLPTEVGRGIIICISKLKLNKILMFLKIPSSKTYNSKGCFSIFLSVFLQNPGEVCTYFNLCEGEFKLQMEDILMNYIQKTITPPTVMVNTRDTEIKSQVKSHQQELSSFLKLFYRLYVHLGGGSNCAEQDGLPCVIIHLLYHL